jgi:hypothetical protein
MPRNLKLTVPVVYMGRYEVVFRGDSLAGEGEPNSEEGTETLVLYVYGTT